MVRIGHPGAQAVMDGPPGTYSSPTQTTSIGASSAELVAANTNRICVIIVNDSSEVVYVAVGTAAIANSGIRLNTNGGIVQFGGMGGLPLTLAAINGIATSAGAVTVQEVTV